LRSRLKVAVKAREMAQTEYLQTGQQAVSDPRAKGRLAILESRVDQQNAEVAYIQSLLDRVDIAAPQDGIAIFEDVNDWLGRPVTVGERILLIADPADTELEIRLPAADAVTFEPGADVAFFLNVAPDAPVRAGLTFAGYRSAPTPEGVLAYRLKASFDDPDTRLRIGLKGTAKIFGKETPIALWILRRPLNLLRQWLVL
jgi:hypothetical protein